MDNPIGRGNILDHWPYLRLQTNSTVQLGTNYIIWKFGGEGLGNLEATMCDERLEYARSVHKGLAGVTLEDSRGAAYGGFPSLVGSLKAGRPHAPLIIRDNEIILLRLRHKPQDVYAIQATDQTQGRGHFRSRQILLSGGGAAIESSVVSPSTANR